MKDLWKSGVVGLLIIGILYIIYLRECKREVCPPENYVLVPKDAWDSIQALANKPPIVRIDTQWIKGDVVYVKDTTLPKPQILKDSTKAFYSDTLDRRGIKVSYNFTIEGRLIDRFWAYNETFLSVRKDSIIYIPNIVQVKNIVYELKNGVYANINIGGNNRAFIPGVGIDYITKKGTQIGYSFQRFGNENFHSIRFGFMIFRF